MKVSDCDSAAYDLEQKLDCWSHKKANDLTNNIQYRTKM